MIAFARRPVPQLTTTGKIAEKLGEPLHRVQHVLRTRHDIRPAARAGVLRLNDAAAVEQVRQALEAIDAARSRKPSRTQHSRPGE